MRKKVGEMGVGREKKGREGSEDWWVASVT